MMGSRFEDAFDFVYVAPAPEARPERQGDGVELQKKIVAARSAAQLLERS